jgi:hypothetical protein
VIDYVRGPMRIAAPPVAAANPNDAGVARRRGKRRWEGGGFERGSERQRFGGGAPGSRPQQPWQGQGGPGAAPSGDANQPGERRRRRRRRRRRGPGVGAGPNAPMVNGAPPDGAMPANGSEEVAFFTPGGPGSQPVVLGPDGQPIRKRRRRRRRGRGGRQREWRGMPGGEGGGGAPPGSIEGGDGGGEPAA